MSERPQMSSNLSLQVKSCCPPGQFLAINDVMDFRQDIMIMIIIIIIIITIITIM